MASKQDIPALLTTKDGYGQLNPELSNRLHTMVDHVEEVVGVEHLIHALRDGTSHGGDGVLRCYVGFEPSGKAHIGWKVLALQLRRMLDANANVMVFLADWHAWVNDKFNGDMDAIKTTGEYMQETFRSLLNHPPEGDGPGELRFKWASELMESGAYWARVLRCSKGATLALSLIHI